MPRVFPVSFWILLCIGLIAWNVAVYRAIFAPPVLTVTILEVGPADKQGNAMLVHSPSGKTILIDTGPDASILRALGTALPPWQRRIDAVILTSAKSSLVGGLPSVESRYHTPTPIRLGTESTPYGASFTLDNARLVIISPTTFTIFYGATSLNISSSTPTGIYISDGQTFMKN